MSNPLIHTLNGAVEARSEDDFTDLLTKLAAADDPRLILFMHGGLVPEQNGEACAHELDDNLLTPLRQDGWLTLYPIWGSGLAETVEANRDELRHSPLFVRIVLRILAWLERHGGAKALALDDGLPSDTEDLATLMAWIDRQPAPDATAIASASRAIAGVDDPESVAIDEMPAADLMRTDLAADFAGDDAFLQRARAHWNSVDAEVRDRAIAPPTVPAPLIGPAALGVEALTLIPGAVAAAFRVIRRFATGRDHGLGPTVVEEICRSLFLDKVGATAWGLMKKEARDHFNVGALGSRLLAALSAIAEHKPIRVLLIGHSAGSVFTSRFTREAVGLPANVTLDTILLAPAVRLDEAADLLATGHARPGGLRIFTMHDALECRNALDGTAFGKVYGGSLLYLIAGVLESRLRTHGKPRSYADAPLLGMERHLDGRGKLDAEERAARAAIVALLGQAPDRIAYSHSPAGAPPGRTTRSEVHGGYWRDPETVDSILHIARHGFA